MRLNKSVLQQWSKLNLDWPRVRCQCQLVQVIFNCSLLCTRSSTAMGKAGVVKFFSRDEGWGFIIPENGGVDVFVHKSAAGEENGYLVPGSNVQYLVEWDYFYWNWRVSWCSGCRFSPEEQKGSKRIKGRRVKDPEKAGLNQHKYSKYQTSSPGARARRHAKKHPSPVIDPRDL